MNSELCNQPIGSGYCGKPRGHKGLCPHPEEKQPDEEVTTMTTEKT